MKNIDYAYDEIDLAACLDLAVGLADGGKRWHSHVLSPGCGLNPYPEAFAIVIENSTDGIAYLARSEGFPEVDKALVRMLHGDDILDEEASRAGGAEISIDSALLERVIELNDDKIPWHHHMNFPGCVFSPRPDKWAITVESGTGDIDFETYDDEPTDVLREIEVLYFRDL
jgi:hypothetical protein